MAVKAMEMLEKTAIFSQFGSTSKRLIFKRYR
jgi:hypothetical protein